MLNRPRVNNFTVMGKNKSVVCKICYRVMRSDKLNRHMKRHDEPVEIEPLQSVGPTNESPPSANDSFYKPTNMDKEMLVKKMLKDDREYKEKMEMGKQMYKIVKEYDIDEKVSPKK